MLEYIGILEKCPLFDGISAAEYPKMLSCLHAKTRNYRKNEVIFTEGEKVRYIGVVLHG